MATRYPFLPVSMEPPTSSPGAINRVNDRPIVWLDAATDEFAVWTGIAPQGLTAPYTVIISYIMASATSGTVVLQAAIEAVTALDPVDLDTTTSFDTVNNSASVTVPGTAGYMDQIPITMTNADRIAAGDYFRLRINRDADTDSATGDLGILAVEFRDAA